MFFDLSNGADLLKIALILPLIAAAISFKVKKENLRDGGVILVAVALLLIVCQIHNFKLENSEPLRLHISNFIDGLPIALEVDYLGVIFSLIASFLWGVTTLYAVGYMRGNNEPNQNRFFGFFAISIFATMGLAFSANLVTLFVFYEVLTLATYPLVTHSGTDEAKQSGRKYLGVLLASSVCLQLPAIIITYLFAGNLDFAETPMLAGLDIKSVYIGLLLLLYVWGIGKTAVMPFHKWLPAAMVAPTPVSALLHAVAVVKAGLFTILKVIVYVFGVETLKDTFFVSPISVGWAAWLAGFTIITASLIALKQDNLKLRLAYSTISQLSYVVLAASLFNHKAIIAGVFHIAAHAFSKITLFFAAGAIYTASKKKYISELGGLAKRMPVTCVCFAIGAISMIGLPPTAGLITKLYLLQAVFERDPALVVVLIVSTILNAMYFLPIIFAMFFEKETVKAKGKYKDHKEAPRAILIAITITAVFTVAIFVAPEGILKLAEMFVSSVSVK